MQRDDQAGGSVRPSPAPGVVIRPLESAEEADLARLISQVMIEFGIGGCDGAVEDSELLAMFQTYSAERHAFFVATRNGQVVAGAGIAPLAVPHGERVCELRKMYALPAARGLGVGTLLLEHCLGFARTEGFEWCYLQTSSVMKQARRLYLKTGFQPIPAPAEFLCNSACDSWYSLRLSPRR